MWRSKPAALLSVCLLAAAVLHFIAYGILRVQPFHWYYSWIAASGAILGPLFIMFCCKQRLLPLSLVTAIAAVGVTLSLNAVVKSQEMPINSNWANVEQYRDIAAWINDNHGEKQFDISGELGVVQYFTNANVTNYFSDRAWLGQYVQALNHQRWLDRMMAVNFRHLRIPEIDKSAYQLTVACNEGGEILKKWQVHSRWQTRTTYCFQDVAK